MSQSININYIINDINNGSDNSWDLTGNTVTGGTIGTVINQPFDIIVNNTPIGTVTNNGINIYGIISGTTYFGDGSNLIGYISGGTYENNILYLFRPNTTPISILLSGVTGGSFINSLTFNNNQLSLFQNTNNGYSSITTTISGYTNNSDFISFTSTTLNKTNLYMDGLLYPLPYITIIGNDIVTKTIVQPDGKILFVGAFTNIDSTGIRNRIFRINPDGSEDNNFRINIGTGFNNTILTAEIQSDSKILIGGKFTTFNGNIRNYIIRLNPDGTEDSSFYNEFTSDSGVFNNWINTIKIDLVGDILVGGIFSGLTKNKICKINSFNHLDLSFTPTFNGEVNTIDVQIDNKILVGGEFTLLGSSVVGNIARLNSDGSEDTSFTSNCIGGNGRVNIIKVLSDNKILVGGEFTEFMGNQRGGISRLEFDGVEDFEFGETTGNGSNSSINSFYEQSDGKILVGGYFTIWDSQILNNNNGIVRLYNNGNIDIKFIDNLPNLNFPSIISINGDLKDILIVDFKILYNYSQLRNLSDLPYKTYSSLLSQTGTNPPTEIILENTYNNQFTWSYSGTNTFILTSNVPVFSIIKTFSPQNGTRNIINGGGASFDLYVQYLDSYRISLIATENLLVNKFIEIRTYK